MGSVVCLARDVQAKVGSHPILFVGLRASLRAPLLDDKNRAGMPTNLRRVLVRVKHASMSGEILGI